MKKNTTVIIVIALALLLGLLYWVGSGTRPERSNEGDIVSTSGIHWHPTLTIYVDGEQRAIPANVGLIASHQPIHTHAEDVEQGVLHFEFGNTVRTGDLALGNFFRIWDNKDVVTAFGTLERMTVNGEENTAYGDYIVGPNDAIELFYTTQNETETGDTSMQVPAPGVDPNSVDEMIVNTDNDGSHTGE